MLAQVVAEPYIESMPVLKSVQSVRNLIVGIYDIITKWNTDSDSVTVSKIISMIAEVDFFDPFMERTFKIILGKLQKPLNPSVGPKHIHPVEILANSAL